jgi:AcrR family transcriptional regulator
LPETRAATRPADARSRRPRAGRAPRNRQQTVATIVAAAADLIARKGPDGFGLAELGSNAGVSFGLIHRYFGGKEGLLKEALRQPFTRQLTVLLERYEDGAAPVRRDRRGAPAGDAARRRNARTPRAGGRREPLLALLFEAQRRNPAYVRLIAWGILTGLLSADLFAEDRGTIERLLALYRRSVRPPREVDARAVSALLLIATLGFELFRPLVQALFDVGDDFDAVYQEHLRTALRTFRGNDPRRGAASGRRRGRAAIARAGSRAR